MLRTSSYLVSASYSISKSSLISLSFRKLFFSNPSIQMDSKRENESAAEEQSSANKKPALNKIAFNPYLYFDGNAKDAVEFYTKVFDAHVETFKVFGDGPKDMGIPEEKKGKVMHAQLNFGDCNLMISDYVMPKEVDSQGPFSAGNNVHISLSMTDIDFMTKSFNELSEGGKVTMPLKKQFWGATFGSLIDRFGIYWMFSSNEYEKPKKKEETTI